MAYPVPMPARGEHTTPIFDKEKPQEIPRFFDDLEYLLEQAQIISETEKKKQVLRYVDFETEQMWKYLPEFRSTTATYSDFK